LQLHSTEHRKQKLKEVYEEILTITSDILKNQQKTCQGSNLSETVTAQPVFCHGGTEHTEKEVMEYWSTGVLEISYHSITPYSRSFFLCVSVALWL